MRQIQKGSAARHTRHVDRSVAQGAGTKSRIVNSSMAQGTGDGVLQHSVQGSGAGGTYVSFGLDGIVSGLPPLLHLQIWAESTNNTLLNELHGERARVLLLLIEPSDSDQGGGREAVPGLGEGSNAC